MPVRRVEEALADPNVIEAIRRGVIAIEGPRITYNLFQQKTYDWADPEEWVRARTVAWLVVERDYPANRIRTEVTVPRRTPSDWADVVVYSDDRCREPFLVVENKPDGCSRRERTQGIEQLFGNCNSLRAPIGLYDEHGFSALFNIRDHPPTERRDNQLGTRSALPKQYGNVPVYAYVAGDPDNDIKSATDAELETKIRRAHSIIWAGGKRDPLTAFDEWSKLLFAKVLDERRTPSEQPRRFQVGTNETTAAVANRIHGLYQQACRDDPSIFPPESRIALPDAKITEVVRTLQALSFTGTSLDSVGRAFEQFFGSIFRGGLGQYFTMRQLARFTVGMLDVRSDDFAIDPTAGSGGFLLEVLLQTWHNIDAGFQGQEATRERLKLDFALQHVYGIEIHEILARICKINLLLHHDGHTNIEGGRSCLDSVFSLPRLNPPRAKFSCVVGNPPFGDTVEAGDDDKLGSNTLESFQLAVGRSKVESEQVIVERCIEMLEPGGRLGLVLPDGLFNNQGDQSNCPQTRRFLAKNGLILAIVSLPDYAFRKSGAQNKTSILFFQKFTRPQRTSFNTAYKEALERGAADSACIAEAVRVAIDYRVFLAEANHIGYNTTGQPSALNDLYRAAPNGSINGNQRGTILGEWHEFVRDPNAYTGRTQPDCMGVRFSELWNAHHSNRLDPKYHLFKREAARHVPVGWIRARLGTLMERRTNLVAPEAEPGRIFTVLTIAQTGEIRAREAGKGKSPPQWSGAYLADMPSAWFSSEVNNVVYSSIDLWKGCIAVVPYAFAGGLVTKEFPVYRVIAPNLLPEFLQVLLRSRPYQRAFRAITTGHSNRRRTQQDDFEALEIVYPPDPDEQRRLIVRISAAREEQARALATLRGEMTAFSDLIDGRGQEELPEVAAGGEDDEDDAE